LAQRIVPQPKGVRFQGLGPGFWAVTIALTLLSIVNAWYFLYGSIDWMMPGASYPVADRAPDIGRAGERRSRPSGDRDQQNHQGNEHRGKIRAVVWRRMAVHEMDGHPFRAIWPVGRRAISGPASGVGRSRTEE